MSDMKSGYLKDGRGNKIFPKNNSENIIYNEEQNVKQVLDKVLNSSPSNPDGVGCSDLFNFTEEARLLLCTLMYDATYAQNRKKDVVELAKLLGIDSSNFWDGTIETIDYVSSVQLNNIEVDDNIVETLIVEDANLITTGFHDVVYTIPVTPIIVQGFEDNLEMEVINND